LASHVGEEHRLRVFENRVLDIKRGEVAGDWRKLYEELHDVYCSPNVAGFKSRSMWAGQVAHMGKTRST
jgi:hypothetical protein